MSLSAFCSLPKRRRYLLVTVGLLTTTLLVTPSVVLWLSERDLIRLVDIDRAGMPLLDWRLAQAARSRAVCRQALESKSFRARLVDDNAISNGCGWKNAVLMSGVGDAQLAPVTLNCATAAALAMWIKHDVQEQAQLLLGARVSKIDHRGGYACRNIRDSSDSTVIVRSEHATANAIDVTRFHLKSGRAVSVAEHWPSTGAEAQFLRRVFLASCKYFRTALGPEYNTDHSDHFHLDRGPPDECP